MLITVAALYVTIPALFALVCVAIAYAFPVTIGEESTVDTTIYTTLRDQAAIQAIRAIQVCRTNKAVMVSTTDYQVYCKARASYQVWADYAAMMKARAIRFNAMLVSQ